MSEARVEIFHGIIARKGSYRGLAQTSVGVFGAYILLLAAALFIGTKPHKPKPPPEKRLVVTLLDLPKISEERSLGESGRAGGGGEAVVIAEPNAQVADQAVAKPSVRTTTKTKTPEKTKTTPTEQPTSPREGATVDPTPSAPTTAQQGAAAASTAPSDNVAQAPTTHAEGSGGGSGSGQGSSAGSGSGSGTGSGGSGVGSGAGARAGAASGDQQTLPFMDGMTRPSLVSKVDPEYTREARDANVEGTLLTKCVIGTDGSLRKCRILKGLPMMDQAVLAALSHWKYTPVMYQGKAVAVEYVIPVKLVLQ